MKFSAARSELDSMIVEIELTLVSIIQGVALTVLIENAHGIVAERQILFWPYLFAGLLVIFVFWSRAVLHIITVILRRRFYRHRLDSLRLRSSSDPRPNAR
jgi:hypothetical protein